MEVIWGWYKSYQNFAEILILYILILYYICIICFIFFVWLPKAVWSLPGPRPFLDCVIGRDSRKMLGSEWHKNKIPSVLMQDSMYACITYKPFPFVCFQQKKLSKKLSKENGRKILVWSRVFLLLVNYERKKKATFASLQNPCYTCEQHVKWKVNLNMIIDYQFYCYWSSYRQQCPSFIMMTSGDNGTLKLQRLPRLCQPVA